MRIQGPRKPLAAVTCHADRRLVHTTRQQVLVKPNVHGQSSDVRRARRRCPTHWANLELLSWRAGERPSIGQQGRWHGPPAGSFLGARCAENPHVGPPALVKVAVKVFAAECAACRCNCNIGCCHELCAFFSFGVQKGVAVASEASAIVVYTLLQPLQP